MTLYEIDGLISAMLEQVDPETGEALFNPADLDRLNMERQQKLENVALFVKNKKAEAEAIKAEIEKLTARKTQAENAVERAKGYLAASLDGERMTTPRVAVSYRRSTVVQADDTMTDPRFYRQKAPELDKLALKKALQSGETIPGAWLEDKQTIIIK